MQIEKLISDLRQAGFRITKTRQALLEIFYKESCLLSLSQIHQCLRKRKLHPNRSTLYRELRFLSDQKILAKQSLDGQDHYELAHDHHHHLVCEKCGELTRVEMKSHLAADEKRLEKQYMFHIFRHELDFYGLCKKCNNYEK